MTEAEWLSSGEPEKMLVCLGEQGLITQKAGGHRRLRLFVVACCRRAWDCFSQEERHAIVVAEVQADRRKQDASAIEAAALLVPEDPPGTKWNPTRCAARFALTDRPWDAACRGPRNVASVVAIRDSGGEWPLLHDSAYNASRARELARQADVLRDVFGNPFHSPTLAPEWLAWGDGVVPALAKGIYEDCAFDRLPILADALEEAGCTDTDVLGHCRGKGPHVRGCWVVDLAMRKK